MFGIPVLFSDRNVHSCSMLKMVIMGPNSAVLLVVFGAYRNAYEDD